MAPMLCLNIYISMILTNAPRIKNEMAVFTTMWYLGRVVRILNQIVKVILQYPRKKQKNENAEECQHYGEKNIHHLKHCLSDVFGRGRLYHHDH